MEIKAKTRQSLSLDVNEKRHFESLSQEWWNPRGQFKTLHAFNPARLRFIVEQISAWRDITPFKQLKPFQDLSILDIGCGGGILSEPLARLGGNLTGIDPVEASIEIAQAHAKTTGLDIDYQAITAEVLADQGQSYDVVIASEVIEHVADVDHFLRICRQLCRSNGIAIFSTLNRTIKSYALAIIAAERVLGLIPQGTHDWHKFITPDQFKCALEIAGFTLNKQSGIVFNPLQVEWQLSPRDLSVNYILDAWAKA